jgi:hypothetical protein
MATILQQIFARLAVIVPANAPAGTTFWPDRADPLSREEAPAVGLVVHDVQSESFADGWELKVAEIDLQIHERSETFTSASEGLHQVLHGPIVNDATLKSLADSIRLVDEVPGLAEADETAGIKTARYRFKFITPTNII